MDEIFGEAALAIYGGDIEGLESILAADPDLATRPSSVSHPTLLQFVACDAAQLPDAIGAARVLVNAGAVMEPPLVAAAGCGSRAVLEYLLDNGANIEGAALWTPLDEALYWARLDIAELFVRRGARIRALSTAAGLNDIEAIEGFFENDILTAAAGPIGSPFNDTIPDPLASDHQSIIDHAFVMAANAGAMTAAKELLERGAAVNAQPPGFHWRGTALHAAVWRGDEAMVSWLLTEGADPSIRDGLANSDAAGWAKHHGHAELQTILQSS